MRAGWWKLTTHISDKQQADVLRSSRLVSFSCSNAMCYIQMAICHSDNCTNCKDLHLRLRLTPLGRHAVWVWVSRHWLGQAYADLWHSEASSKTSYPDKQTSQVGLWSDLLCSPLIRAFPFLANYFRMAERISICSLILRPFVHATANRNST